jgi:hypothetical protein
MAAGYLDLLQRELRDTVIHPFLSVADLTAHAGIEGQVASTEGSFYIFTSGAWRRILNETDLSFIEAELGRSASLYTVQIPAGAGAVGAFQVLHGFEERPLVNVTGPDGALIEVDIIHLDGQQRCNVLWRGVLPTPSTVSCVGQSVAAPVA